MKNTIIIAVFAIIISLISSCSDSTSPNEGTVNIVSEMVNPFVTIVPEKSKQNNEIQANEVDSIHITNVRILISELKLHVDATDTLNSHALKTGPFLFHIDDLGNVIQLTSTSVPVGTYEKMKFEFHRFSSNEISQFATDPILKDFATSDRYTIIITGIYYKNNVPNDFTYNSKITANFSIKFDPSINIEEGTTTIISIQIDPILVLNFSDIENTIKSTIKAQKRS